MKELFSWTANDSLKKEIVELKRNLPQSGLLSHKRKDGNSYFESDYKRIVTSPAFRRLQDKTQVFPLERNDFVRTRLTHSIEVAAIANQLVDAISRNTFIPNSNKHSPDIKASFQDFVDCKDIISAILESASALHDIGNPPFGHFGETIIQQWFKQHFPTEGELPINISTRLPKDVSYDCFIPYLCDFYEFEGNAQALRIITKLDDNVASCGMNLTYTTINTIIKYTCSSAEKNEVDSSKVFNKKIGYFLSEKDIFDEVTTVTGVKKARHPLTFILEAADDIAYITADIEDAIKKGLFTRSDFQHDLKESFTNLIEILPYGKQLQHYRDFLSKIMSVNEREVFNEIRNFFILGASFIFCTKYKEIMCGDYNSDLFDDQNYVGVYHSTYKFLKNYSIDHIFNTRDILKLEIAGNEILGFLLNKFVLAVLPYEDLNQVENKLDRKMITLISSRHREVYEKSIQRAKNAEEKLYLRLLMVTDFISGMTDSYAQDLYLDLSGHRRL